jgi:hypothetical protein
VNSTVSNAFRNFIQAEHAQLLSLGIESAENPHSSMNTVQEKPFAFGEKTLPFGIPINVRQPVITPNAFSQL